jgi:porin
MQSFSNIDVADFRALGEVYVQQTVLNDRLRVKVGRLDFNSEFGGTVHGVAFLNSSMGYTPAITAAPTYPLPVGGVNVMVSPRDGLHLSAGVFDGTRGAPAVEGRTSRFQIAQAAQEWAGGATGLDGRIGVGAWRHTGRFNEITDNPESESTVAGTHGWYATLDQTLWRGAARANDNANRATVAGFLQLGEADKHVAAVSAHRGGGLTFTGLWSHRSSDVVGLGVTDAEWYGGRETIQELFYQMPVFSHLSLVADWQSVGRRASLEERAKGHVFTLRSIVSF